MDQPFNRCRPGMAMLIGALALMGCSHGELTAPCGPLAASEAGDCGLERAINVAIAPANRDLSS